MAFLEKHVKPALLSRVTRWVEEHAILAVAVPAILPPPMPLSPFVLVAGAVHMSRRKFMIAFTTSRFLRHVIAAWLGIRYGKQVLGIWAHFSERWGTMILISLWSIILLFTAIGIWQLYRTSRSMDIRGTKGRNSPTDQPA
jgi:membrane protein DedA with SNARE-associated domain